MTHNTADGGVVTVYWSCVASSDGDPVYTATEGGKERWVADPSAPGFVSYSALTEETVLGWVYSRIAEASEVENETPDQAKARIEAERIAKVDAQVQRAANESTGLPWAS